MLKNTYLPHKLSKSLSIIIIIITLLIMDYTLIIIASNMSDLSKKTNYAYDAIIRNNFSTVVAFAGMIEKSYRTHNNMNEGWSKYKLNESGAFCKAMILQEVNINNNTYSCSVVLDTILTIQKKYPGYFNKKGDTLTDLNAFVLLHDTQIGKQIEKHLKGEFDE